MSYGNPRNPQGFTHAQKRHLRHAYQAAKERLATEEELRASRDYLPTRDSKHLFATQTDARQQAYR